MPKASGNLALLFIALVRTSVFFIERHKSVIFSYSGGSALYVCYLFNDDKAVSRDRAYLFGTIERGSEKKICSECNDGPEINYHLSLFHHGRGNRAFLHFSIVAIAYDGDKVCFGPVIFATFDAWQSFHCFALRIFTIFTSSMKFVNKIARNLFQKSLIRFQSWSCFSC